MPDPSPFDVVNSAGGSPVFLTCEHAGRAIPRALGDLGIAASEMERHIAYDIGAEQVSLRLSRRLDAALVLQPYSRLVVDCNRPFDATDCIPEVSDGTAIPANAKLNASVRQQRFDGIHQPFHDEIRRLLDKRLTQEKPTVLVSVHSFTPKLLTACKKRPWHIGLLHNRDDKLARQMMTSLNKHAVNLQTEFNEPYAVDDLSDYTIPVHGEKRGIPHVLLEIRNDEIVSSAGQERWAGILAAVLSDIPEGDR